MCDNFGCKNNVTTEIMYLISFNKNKMTQERKKLDKKLRNACMLTKFTMKSFCEIMIPYAHKYANIVHTKWIKPFLCSTGHVIDT